MKKGADNISQEIIVAVSGSPHGMITVSDSPHSMISTALTHLIE